MKQKVCSNDDDNDYDNDDIDVYDDDGQDKSISFI